MQFRGVLGIGVAPAAATAECLSLSNSILFPTTQVGSSNANALDDYEEGTWTAGFTAGTGTITINTSQRTGTYTKLGRLVTITGYFAVTSVSSPTGALTLTGLPFTTSATDSYRTSCCIYADALLSSATTAIQGSPVANGTTIPMNKFAAGVAVNTLAADVTASSIFLFNCSYIID